MGSSHSESILLKILIVEKLNIQSVLPAHIMRSRWTDDRGEVYVQDTHIRM